jgi:hypothetical protein
LLRLSLELATTIVLFADIEKDLGERTLREEYAGESELQTRGGGLRMISVLRVWMSVCTGTTCFVSRGGAERSSVESHDLSKSQLGERLLK